MYKRQIQTYAKTYGVPVDLAHAVVRVESNFNPKARGSAGEIGLMQIKPATARMMGYSGSAKGCLIYTSRCVYETVFMQRASGTGFRPLP